MLIECDPETAHHLAEQIVNEVWHSPGGEHGISDILNAGLDTTEEHQDEPKLCICGEGKNKYMWIHIEVCMEVCDINVISFSSNNSIEFICQNCNDDHFCLKVRKYLFLHGKPPGYYLHEPSDCRFLDIMQLLTCLFFLHLSFKFTNLFL